MVRLVVDVSNARCLIKASCFVQMFRDFEVRGAQDTICADRDRNIAMSVKDDLILRF